MKTFSCSSCGNRVHFENVACLACGAPLGFDAESLAMVALAPVAEPGAAPASKPAGLFRVVGRQGDPAVRYCDNAVHGCCNWLAPAADTTGLCTACDLNRTIPNLSEWGSLEAWQALERAKKRLIYSLLRFAVPVDATDRGKDKLSFDFVRDAKTGHLDGVITIDVAEANAVERERQRQFFGEPFRTLLGHLRHESGHFYWKLLVEGSGFIDEFRSMFGDERQDYQAALQHHHSMGPSADWQRRHVSPYASSHPWEDWAETWAHYVHMVDAIDTAESVGMEPRAAGLSFGAIWPFKTTDVYRDRAFTTLIDRWIPLSTAMNSLNRSMGHDDFYPFVLSEPVLAKLDFVHRVIDAGRRQNGN